MEEQKKEFIQWVKTHKKDLIIAGVSIAAIIGIIVGIKNKDSIMALWESLRKSMEKDPVKSLVYPCEMVEKITYESVPVVDAVSLTEITKFPSSHNSQVSFEVCDHIRNLPDGWNASAKKIATAAEHGYNLKPGQTWVYTYTKRVAVA